MRARIVKIGNSQGIRIPKPLLDQIGIIEDAELELKVEENHIVIRPISNPRSGWEDAFRTMEENEDDALLDGDVTISNSWDETEWQWW